MDGTLKFLNRAEFRAWLEEICRNHDGRGNPPKRAGVRLFRRYAVAYNTPPKRDAPAEALCQKIL